ncbi:MAG: GIY-YIG nuclease family protein [Patescibacteria group bacterium]
MYYVYLVKLPNETIYVGFSTDLKKRIKTHQREKQILGLIYYEAYQDKKDAMEREKQLKKYKSAWGYLKKRIKRSTESI